MECWINEDIPLKEIEGKMKSYKFKRVCPKCKKSFFTVHKARMHCRECMK